jgi:hypothetical protein
VVLRHDRLLGPSAIDELLFIPGGDARSDTIKTLEAKDAKLVVERGIADAIPELCLYSRTKARASITRKKVWR